MALAFAHPDPLSASSARDREENDDDDEDDDDDDDDDEGETGKVKGRERWLVSGGKDGRVAVWELMEFEKGKNGGRKGGEAGRMGRSNDP
jgi:hypothetical protein